MKKIPPKPSFVGKNLTYDEILKGITTVDSVLIEYYKKYFEMEMTLKLTSLKYWDLMKVVLMPGHLSKKDLVSLGIISTNDIVLPDPKINVELSNGISLDAWLSYFNNEWNTIKTTFSSDCNIHLGIVDPMSDEKIKLESVPKDTFNWLYSGPLELRDDLLLILDWEKDTHSIKWTPNF